MTVWNPQLYEAKHAFVWKSAGAALELLAAKPGERILDLGCGTGKLTAALADAGIDVMGIDRDPHMIAQARRNAPHVRFEVADARAFAFDAPFDAVFSNAVLHWIPASDADTVLACVRGALAPGGRFVAEMGGEGNVASLVAALLAARRARGLAAPATLSPWYFPDPADYRTRCERAGLDVTYCALAPRPTRLEDGDRGLAHWIEMFAGTFLADVRDPETRAELIADVRDRLRPWLFHDGAWHADYVRLRVAARRPAA